jgi:16S rRNA (guanine527-N7)-methyltransferase
VALQEQLRLWNSRLNLTRLVEGEDFWISQVVDSLWPLVGRLNGPPGPLRCVDVGTGGGFPGLAVAIALPQARLTLIDSVGRKVEAVRAMAQALGLADRISLRCERVERSGRERSCRGQFDLALARAVAAAPVVAEYLVPLLASGGEALLYRGHWSDPDTEELQRALVPLRAGLHSQVRRNLPAERGVRHALVVQPLGPCPAAYPRAVGVPAKQPLGSL